MATTTQRPRGRRALPPNEEAKILRDVDALLNDLGSPSMAPTSSVTAKIVQQSYDSLKKRRATGWSWPALGRMFRERGIPITHESLRRAFRAYEERVVGTTSAQAVEPSVAPAIKAKPATRKKKKAAPRR